MDLADLGSRFIRLTWCSWLVLLFLPSLTGSPGSILQPGSLFNFVRLVYSRYIVLLVNLAFLLKVVDLVTWLAGLT